MQLARWYRKLFKNEHPKYLVNLIPVRSTPYATRTVGNIPLIKTKHKLFKNSFFALAVIEWNNLNHNIRNVESFSIFKNNILNLSGQPPIMFLVVKIIVESNLLQDCVLVLVICVNTNSNTVFKIH